MAVRFDNGRVEVRDDFSGALIHGATASRGREVSHNSACSRQRLLSPMDNTKAHRLHRFDNFLPQPLVNR